MSFDGYLKYSFKGFQGKRKSRRGRVWTKERRNQTAEGEELSTGKTGRRIGRHPEVLFHVVQSWAGSEKEESISFIK